VRGKHCCWLAEAASRTRLFVYCFLHESSSIAQTEPSPTPGAHRSADPCQCSSTSTPTHQRCKGKLGLGQLCAARFFSARAFSGFTAYTLTLTQKNGHLTADDPGARGQFSHDKKGDWHARVHSRCFAPVGLIGCGLVGHTLLAVRERDGVLLRPLVPEPDACKGSGAVKFRSPSPAYRYEPPANATTNLCSSNYPPRLF